MAVARLAREYDMIWDWVRYTSVGKHQQDAYPYAHINESLKGVSPPAQAQESAKAAVQHDAFAPPA